ncbi:MAG: hypothetical protein ACNS63_08085 [Candidatus Nitrospinota bacterium M3_3B_026]
MMDKPQKPRAKFSPHISAGVISVRELKELVDVMEREGAEKVKLGGEIIFVWDKPDLPRHLEEKTGRRGNDFKFGGVRPVKMCSAETFCRRYQKPVLGLAMEIDRMFNAVELPTKLMIGVAGCQRSCSEPATKDIGIIASPKGYQVLVGGAAGLRPRIAEKLTVAPTRKRVLEIVENIIKYVRKHGDKTTRLGALIEKRGMDEFVREVL